MTMKDYFGDLLEILYEIYKNLSQSTQPYSLHKQVFFDVLWGSQIELIHLNSLTFHKKLGDDTLTFLSTLKKTHNFTLFWNFMTVLIVKFE